jgi:hypothetical protein
MGLLGAYFAARLAEPSTWAGIALLVQNVGTAAATHNWANIASAVGGALAAIVPETGGAAPKI